MTTADVIVVGAGAVGASSAYELARRGRSVLVVERFARGHAHGGSHGRARIFRLAYPEPDYVRLAVDSLPRWRELEAEAGVALLTTTGGVDHGDPAALDAARTAMDACGVAWETLSAAEAGARFGGLRFDGGVLYQRDAGTIDADATVDALLSGAGRLGAELRFEERARRVDGATVETDATTYTGRVVIVAGGPWTPSLVDAGPIRVTFEQPAFFRPLVEGWPTFIHHGGAPRGASGAVAAAYGLPSVEGVKVGLHMTGVEAPADAQPDPDPGRTARLADYVRGWVPGVDPEPVDVDVCPYDTTPSEDFVLDRRGDVVIATGFSGHGFKFVPAIGRIVADLAEGRPALDRFRLA